MSAAELEVTLTASVTRQRRTLESLREYGIVASFVALFVALALASPNFLTTANLENLLSQQAPTLIIATAGTLVVIAGGFDLSVGGAAALTGIVAAKVAEGGNGWLGIFVAVAAGAGLGIGNGLVVTRGRIDSLIATLATSYVIRGIGVVATAGLLITVQDSSFATLGRGKLGTVPITIFVMIIFVICASLALSRTSYGSRLYAVGANAEAARLAGIRVGLVRCSTFAISGLAAGIGGAILASQVSTAQSNTATGLEFTVLAGIVVGGTSIKGGQGAVWRTVLGVLFIAIINNGFTLLGIDPIYSQIVEGGVILGAVALDAWSRRSK